MKTLLIQFKIILTLTMLVSVSATFAQKAEEPDNNYSLGANINEMTLTEGGTLVVATNDGLVGIKPGTNELLFNFTDYGKVKPEELTFVPMAPYVIVGQVGFASISPKRQSSIIFRGKLCSVQKKTDGNP